MLDELNNLYDQAGGWASSLLEGNALDPFHPATPVPAGRHPGDLRLLFQDHLQAVDFAMNATIHCSRAALRRRSIITKRRGLAGRC